MGDTYGVVKVEAVEAAAVFLDREGRTAKASRIHREAGAQGARVIGFPEGFIPAHPVWYHHHAATGAVSNRLPPQLFKHAVEIPGPPRWMPTHMWWSAWARSCRAPWAPCSTPRSISAPTAR